MKKLYGVHPHGARHDESCATSPDNSFWLYREDAEADQALKNYCNRVDNVEYFVANTEVPDEEWAKLISDVYDGVPPQPLEEFRDYLQSLHYSDADIAEDFDDRLIIKEKRKIKMAGSKQVRNRLIGQLPRRGRRRRSSRRSSGSPTKKIRTHEKKARTNRAKRYCFAVHHAIREDVPEGNEICFAVSNTTKIYVHREDAEADEAWRNHHRDWDKYSIFALEVSAEEWDRNIELIYGGIAPAPLDEFRGYLQALGYSDARIAEEFNEQLRIIQ
jgi:hypothetical protein